MFFKCIALLWHKSVAWVTITSHHDPSTNVLTIFFWQGFLFWHLSPAIQYNNSWLPPGFCKSSGTVDFIILSPTAVKAPVDTFRSTMQIEEEEGLANPASMNDSRPVANFSPDCPSNICYPDHCPLSDSLSSINTTFPAYQDFLLLMSVLMVRLYLSLGSCRV